MNESTASDGLEGLALAPSKFVHFKHPASDELVYRKAADGEDDPERPVGVRVYGPGSKEYRVAQTALTNEQIQRGRKKITAEMIQRNAVETLARCTYEFVNFDYAGKPAGLEANRAFYADDRFVHFREQIQSEMGDFGGFLPNALTT
jgi:hypothetical protein